MSNDTDIARALHDIPAAKAPPGEWTEIADRAAELGLFDAHPTANTRRFWLPLAAAASVLLAVLITVKLTPTPAPAQPLVSAEARAIDVLMRQSQLLEAWLRASPPGPRVVTVGTASRETALRDRIAAIDWELSEPTVEHDDAVRARLWSERSQRMRELVSLRYRTLERQDI